MSPNVGVDLQKLMQECHQTQLVFGIILQQALLPWPSTPFLTPHIFTPGVTTFYVESGRLSATKTQNTNLGATGTSFGLGNPGGNMFNITANKSLKIDSLALNLNTTNTVNVNVYAKAGSYISGSQANLAAWTLIQSQKVVGKGIGKESKVRIWVVMLFLLACRYLYSSK